MHLEGWLTAGELVCDGGRAIEASVACIEASIADTPGLLLTAPLLYRKQTTCTP